MKKTFTNILWKNFCIKRQIKKHPKLLHPGERAAGGGSSPSAPPPSPSSPGGGLPPLFSGSALPLLRTSALPSFGISHAAPLHSTCLGACLQRKEEGKDDELYCFGFRRPKNGRTASGIKDVGSGPRRWVNPPLGRKVTGDGRISIGCDWWLSYLERMVE